MWVELFHVGKLFGFDDVMDMPAKAVDAFCVLEQELRVERLNDNQ